MNKTGAKSKSDITSRAIVGSFTEGVMKSRANTECSYAKET